MLQMTHGPCCVSSELVTGNSSISLMVCKVFCKVSSVDVSKFLKALYIFSLDFNLSNPAVYKQWAASW